MAKKRKREPSSQSFSRRKFLALASLGLISGGSGLNALLNKHISFEDAQKDPSLRESFVNQLKAEYQRPYITGVAYSSETPAPVNPEIRPQGIGAEVVGLNPADMGSRKAYEVRVYPGAFSDNVKTERDFLSMIVDHEIEGHAAHFHFGGSITAQEFQLIDSTYHPAVQPMLELVAYSGQLQRAQTRGVSPEYKDNIVQQYCSYYGQLLTSPREEFVLKNPETIRRAETLFFDPTLLSVRFGTTPLITRDGSRFLYLLPNNERLALPDHVVKKILSTN